MSIESKQCSYCKEAKPVSEFNRHTKRPDGLQSYCRSCENQRTRREFLAAIFRVSPTGTCQYFGCTISDPDMLEIDHKDGGGNADRRESGGAAPFFRKVGRGERSVDDLQVLCSNHHAKKTRQRA